MSAECSHDPHHTGTRMNRLIVRGFPAMLLFAIACGGCGTATINHYGDPGVKTLAPLEKSLLVEPSQSFVRVSAVDGRKLERVSAWQARQFWLRPGIHNVVVSFNNGIKRSVHNAELSFATEAGRRYQVEDWPPKVIDLTKRQWVQHQLRVAD